MRMTGKAINLSFGVKYVLLTVREFGLYLRGVSEKLPTYTLTIRFNEQCQNEQYQINEIIRMLERGASS